MGEIPIKDWVENWQGKTSVIDYLGKNLPFQPDYIVTTDGTTFWAYPTVAGLSAYTGTDASTVINAALAAASHVHMKSGTFPCILKLNSKNCLDGAGPSTILKLPNGSNNASVISLANVNVELTRVANLLINGNASNVTGTCHGIAYDNVGGAGYSISNTPIHTIENVKIINCLTDGLLLGDYSVVHDATCLETRVLNVEVDSVGKYGFQFFSSDIVVDNCTASNTGATEAGFWFKYGDPRVKNCKAFNSYYGFRIDSSDGEFNNCIAQTCNSIGFRVIWKNNALSNCHALICCQTAGTTGISVEGNGNRIIGCESVGAAQNYGISLTLGATNNVIENNFLVGNLVTGLNDASLAFNFIQHNPGATDYRYRYLDNTYGYPHGTPGNLAFGTAGRVYMSPIQIPENVTIDGIFYHVGTTSAGNVTLGLYGPVTPIAGAPPDLPDAAALVVQSASVAQSAGSVFQFVSFPATPLRPGLYFAVIEGSDVTGTMLRIYDGGVFLFSRSYDRAGGYGALTDPVPASSTFNGIVPIVLRVASVP